MGIISGYVLFIYQPEDSHPCCSYEAGNNSGDDGDTQVPIV
jgi:hypothetical protein